MSAPAPSLADASDARQARLLALRQRRGAAGADAPVLRARNFDPETRTLRKRADAGEDGDTVEGAVEGVVAAALAEDDARHTQDLDLLNIAPRRANWDLRREMERKTAKLERRTQEAVHALIRALPRLFRVCRARG
jgi:coiled-coil domain-containing protein 12